MTDSPNTFTQARRFLSAHLVAVSAISAGLLIPCFWQRRIEAGDLASHTYNAWLAQLVTQGKAPSLYTVWQWTNLLFDLLLLYSAKVFGFVWGPKLAVALCVLVFFWGVFGFAAVASLRVPWVLAPWMAMLTYGFTFNMGFFNYYLSIGWACWALAFCWRAKGGGAWLLGAAFLCLAVLAHPLGSLWCVGTFVYVSLRKRLSWPIGLVMPATAIALFVAVNWVLRHSTRLGVAWPGEPFYFWNGTDQLEMYSGRFRWIAMACLAIAAVWILREFFSRDESSGVQKQRALFLELYLLAFFITCLLPQDLRPDPTGPWMGILVARLTIVTAIFGLCALNGLRPSRVAGAALAACALFFFVLLYRETAAINRMEQSAEGLTAKLPYGTLVIPTIPAGDARSPFIGHAVDRACVRRCFVYSNYEIPSQDFRLRARAGSPLIVSTDAESEAMESGDYVVQPGDPPFVNIYPCSGEDVTALCSRTLHAGEPTGPPDDDPAPEK
jgi:hypothetical protein